VTVGTRSQVFSKVNAATVLAAKVPAIVSVTTKVTFCVLAVGVVESVSSSKDCQYIESDIKNLLRAKLTLFKIPTPCEEELKKSKCPFYNGYPLLDYFSAYSCIYEPPVFDYGVGGFFEDLESCCYMEADISCIVRAWIDEKIENKGLRLTYKRGSKLITYALDTYEIIGMHPMLRLTYEESICEPLSSVPCVVKID